MKTSKWMKLFASLFALSLIAAACGGATDTVEGAADAVADAAEGGDDAASDAVAEAQAAQAEAEAAAADAEARAEAAEAAAAEAGEGDDDAVPVVTVSGPERSEAEAGALNQALQEFGNANGISIIYQGSADWETEINIQLEAGTNPDISVFPQPGNLRDAADAGHVQEVPASIIEAAQARTGPQTRSTSRTSTAPSSVFRTRTTSSRSFGTSQHASKPPATTFQPPSTTCSHLATR